VNSTIPREYKGMIRSCSMQTEWISDLSDVVVMLLESVRLAVDAMCVTLDPPPPPEPIVEVLRPQLDQDVIEDYYYDKNTDILGVGMEPKLWHDVVTAFAWVVIDSFYQAEDWASRGKAI
jgi:hypothetical protein